MKLLAPVSLMLALVSVTLVKSVSGQAQPTPWDHVHFAVPDPPAAIEWYQKYIGAVGRPNPPTHMMMGATRFDFQKSATAQPSAGASVDHIGISVPDLDAKMKQLEAAGVKIVTPTRDVPGLFKLAFVEDPWGTKIELVQDPETPGFHHVHLLVPNPDETLAWYQDKFGGQRTKLKGRLDAVKYGDVWLLAQRGDGMPTRGHSIDHIGWRAADIGSKVTELKGKGATFTSEPRPITFLGDPIIFSFIEGPAGTRIELMQR